MIKEIKEFGLDKVLPLYFNINKIESVKVFGKGLINKTYLIIFKETSYILQKINRFVFNSPISVMYNIDLVTNHIKSKILYEGKDVSKATLSVVPTTYGESFAISNDDYWRCYNYISGITYENTADLNVLYEEGKTISNFHLLLEDFNAGLLCDNIEGFHDTKKRYDNLCNTIKLNKSRRIKECKKEIILINKYKEEYNLITNALRNNIIPYRVVHNDTKLNNIMFEKNTNKGLCLIDLDTTMKGSILYDYGDALRYSASLIKEDSTDLDKVGLNINAFEAFTKGFLEGAKSYIKEEEIKLLVSSYFLMTIELAIRFLDDYLNYDTYFKLDENEKKKRPKLNYERAKNQLTLALVIKNKEKELIKVLNKLLLELGYNITL